MASQLLSKNTSLYQRCDRSISNSDKDSGGGVLIAVGSSLLCTQLTTSVTDVECVFVKVLTKAFPLILCAAYIPPNMPISKYERFCDAVIDVASSNPAIDNFVILGDFNQPDTNWKDTSSCSLSSASQSLVSLAELLQLYQHNRIVNHRGVILDLIFTPFTDTIVSPADDVIIPEELNHPPLNFSINLNCAKTNSNPCSSHNFRRCNLDAVFAWIQGLSYPTVDSTKAEEHFTIFCRNLADVIKLNSPIRNSKRSTFPKWFTAELRRLVIEKKTVHRRFKETGDLSLYDYFRKLRNRCRQLAGECYRDYTNYVESAIPNNIKVFWAHINSLKKANITSNLVYNDVEVDEPSGQCELFADYFSSVYTNMSLLPSSDFDFRTSVNLHSLVLNCSTSGIKT
ncbi:uncharacterized protein LOC124371728 [Homalodisca vitripennis]|uniref:uncharacterized protein LOC124371728 n=1 Tax=Homalodisca vitripennis TaxID=197043 RepID=UPI001EEBCF81|nr:uncharacterized protein LOC124371728 [Homalodisca vitripennis]